MFIKKIVKKNPNSDKLYTYYRLMHTYKVGGKVRQQIIINLGKLEDVVKEDHKRLANRIEEVLTGNSSLFSDLSDELENKAQHLVSEIVRKGIFPAKQKKRSISKDIKEDYCEVDVNSIEQQSSLSIGGEWLVKQAFEDFDMKELLSSVEMNDTECSVAQQLLTAKLLHPSSELETRRWLKESSAAGELFPISDARGVSRYRLYKAAEKMYQHKDTIEQEIYSKTCNMFSGRSKIVIYDLTNMYFEGQMSGSRKAKHGKSKEKRSDCRLVGLALAIDSLGFVRYSSIYPGNIYEPDTFENMLKEVVSQFANDDEIPMVIMDAEIAIDGNIKVLKNLHYDYVCVSRTLPRGYENVFDEPTVLSDNRNNKIEVRKVYDKEKQEVFLHIKSDRKRLKEQSMESKTTERFIERLQHLKEGLSMPRRTKKITTVHESIGRIKDQFSRVAKNYKISYVEDKEKGVVTDIIWQKKSDTQRPKGEYFLRFSKEKLTEEQIWDNYNLTREVEACFRVLKTDLNIRPIHHQLDQYIEPHIWLSVVAYQFTRFVRLRLKAKDINYSWSTIVEKMQTQQLSVVSINKKGNSKIYAKLVTRPSIDQQSLYDALGYEHRPFVRKTKVVPQL